MKRPKNPTDSTPATAKHAYEICGSILDRIAAAVNDNSVPDGLSEIATIGHKVAQIGAELRKSEAAEAKAADIPPAVLLERIRKMPEHERNNLVAEINAMSRKGSVL